MPELALLERARKRARSRGLEFNITRDIIVVPAICPVLGIAIVIGGGRSDRSPSLDRIKPALGYVTGNIRVICDRANRLKSNHTLGELQRLASAGDPALRAQYQQVAAYVFREELLQAAREQLQSKRIAAELKQLLPLVERMFATGLFPSNYAP